MRTLTVPLEGGKLVLGPLLAATIRDHREAIGQARQGQLEPMEMLELTCALAHSCAQRVQPAITLADVEQLVDMENFSQVFSACWGVTVPPGAGVGEAAAVQPSPST